jgi:DNA-directed RNA polymerase subunit M/transcription elongation factor TFIIS
MSDCITVLCNDRNYSYYYSLTPFSELRDNAKKSLSYFLKNQKNIEILEQVIYDNSQNKTEYSNNIKFVIGVIFEKDLKEIVKDIKSRNTKFNSNTFDISEENIKKEVAKIQTPIEAVEGVFQCKKCGSKKTYHIAIQTRRSDEPPTIDIRCLNKECLYKWRVG